MTSWSPNLDSRRLSAINLLESNFKAMYDEIKDEIKSGDQVALLTC